LADDPSPVVGATAEAVVTVPPRAAPGAIVARTARIMAAAIIGAVRQDAAQGHAADKPLVAKRWPGARMSVFQFVI